MLAAVGSGIFPNLPAALAAMVHPAETILPNMDNQKVYNAAFEKYRELNRRNFGG